MFDLELAIAEWRTQMSAAGLQTPALLDELENHLRDDVEEQMRSGTDAGEAFSTARQRLGSAVSLQAEFKKAGDQKGDALRRCGAIGLCGTVILNLHGLLVFHKSAAVFFCDPWWSDWFPSYACWIVFMIVGFGNGRSPGGAVRQ